MKRVGLTGNIGSGKSTVIKIFEVLGVPIFSSDQVGRELYSREDVKQKLRSLFPEYNFYPQGIFQKSILAQLIFSDAKALQTVNELIHPLVEAEFKKWSFGFMNEPYVIQESAILFENRLEYRYDKIILVTAPESVRLSRVMERDNVSKSQVLMRMNNQMTEQEMQLKSDYIINNDGCHMLIPQVVKLNEGLQKEA